MKILLITHNPMSTDNNMGRTIRALFSEFPKDALCQLYVQDAVPDVDTCRSYYRITDREVLKRVFTFGAPGGVVSVERSSIPCELEASKFTLTEQQRSSAFARLGRDLMWKLSRWYSKDLKAWLEREKPTHIFLAPGYAKFIYDIALKIANDLSIPMVTYICDDYYFIKKPSSILGRRWLHLLRKKTEMTMKKTACLVTITDGLRDRYTQAFGCPAVTVMTGAEHPAAEAPRAGISPQAISYFGNILCGRHIALREVGEILAEINQERGTAYTLDVYTATSDPALLRVLEAVPTIRLGGFLTGDAYEKAFRASALLLHVEAFDAESRDLVKYSMSTKIADSLASGIPMIAYGPAEVASMKHLADHDCALVCTSREHLREVLLTALEDEAARTHAATQGLCAAATFHDRRTNSQRLKDVFTRLG